ncbi:MAG: glycerophosphodiester phosphodiesterase, partial [Ruminococcaceae bacterium]|nr:glycerophosphodiester phosphodiesterase [Oscillospiraceae bacterium]
KMLPEQSIQWLTYKEIDEAAINNILEHKLDIDAHYKLLSRELIEKLHAKGVTVNCWTVDDKEMAEKLIEWGVDMITSNILE